jgi:hypothetical protein
MLTRKPVIHTYSITQIPWVAGGDPDVYTKPGRKTHIHITVDQLRLSEDGRSILAHVLYEVREGRSDWTVLKFEQSDAQIAPVPYDYPKVLEIVDTTDFDMQVTHTGQYHTPFNFSNEANSCVSSGSYSIDGKGDDNLGNANVAFNIRIWVMVEDPV